MNDEVMLTRAKRTDGKGWTRGYYARLTDSSKGKVSHRIYTGYAESEADGGEHTFYPDWYEVDPATLCKSTGLRDAEGELVYQGDIVNYPIQQGGFRGKELHEVVFEQRGGSAYFGIKMDHLETWSFGMEVPTKLMKVVGNIYDDPKLIGGGT